MASKNVTATSCDCHPQPRAVSACSMHPHGPTEIRAEQADRTSTSERAADAYRDWSAVPPSERPLVKHRAAHARILFEVLRDHAVSRSWFALQIGVNEKQVRKMLKGEVGIPSTAVACMPDAMRMDFLERLGGSRPSLEDRIARLDRSGLLDALARISAALGSK